MGLDLKMVGAARRLCLIRNADPDELVVRPGTVGGLATNIELAYEELDDLRTKLELLGVEIDLG